MLSLTTLVVKALLRRMIQCSFSRISRVEVVPQSRVVRPGLLLSEVTMIDTSAARSERASGLAKVVKSNLGDARLSSCRDRFRCWREYPFQHRNLSRQELSRA